MPSVVPAVVSSFGCTAVTASELSPPAGRARSILARPKSRTFACPRGLTKMFAGLRSRCTIPLACADSSASAICTPTSRRAARSAGPRRTRSASVSPSSSSMAMKCWPLVLVDRVDGADAGVVQLGGGLGLALEALEGGRVPGHLRGEELEGHAASEPRVLRLVDDAHAPAAQPRRDPVVRDRLADHRRVVRIVAMMPSLDRSCAVRKNVQDITGRRPTERGTAVRKTGMRSRPLAPEAVEPPRKSVKGKVVLEASER